MTPAKSRAAMVTDALALPSGAGDLDELADCAVEALREVNRELIELARSGGGKRTIGTTVVGLAIADGSFRCFWLGDSRAYRLRDGAIKRSATTTAWCRTWSMPACSSRKKPNSHENANLITRAVGVAETCEVDVAQRRCAGRRSVPARQRRPDPGRPRRRARRRTRARTAGGSGRQADRHRSSRAARPTMSR